MNKFTELDKSRLYVMEKNNQQIFKFIIDSENNMRVLTGSMKGYIIVPENQHLFDDSKYTWIDIGDAPTVASIKVGVSKSRPRTPE